MPFRTRQNTTTRQDTTRQRDNANETHDNAKKVTKKVTKKGFKRTQKGTQRVQIKMGIKSLKNATFLCPFFAHCNQHQAD